MRISDWSSDVCSSDLLGLTLAFGVGVASIAPLWKRNLRRTPLFTWGMVIAHLGVAVSLAGMASESAFNKEELIAARPGDKVRIADWTVTFDSISPIDRKSTSLNSSH